MSDSNDPVVLQLERILTNPPLSTSPSLSRLLRFIVEETLDGRAESINEVTLGTRVFNRREDFNPRTDPIVRVQSHHLRARLTQYYSGAGANDAVVIELPPRTYVPVFRTTQSAVEAPVPVPPPQQQAVPPKRDLRATMMVAAITGLIALASGGVLWNGRVFGAFSTRHVAKHQPGPAVEDLYVRGRYQLDRQTEASLRQSVDSFQQAIADDPGFAAAFSGLADAYNQLAQYGYVPPREGMEKARHAAQQALAIDPQLAEGHVSMAAIMEAYDWNWAAAEREYRRAIELNPALPAAHLWYGMFLRDQGRVNEALPELRRAEQLEPLSVLGNVNLAYGLLAAGDSSAALEPALRAVELDPETPTAGLLLASVYRSRSDATRADQALADASRHTDGNPHALSVLACIYAKLGRRADSLRLLHQVEQMAAQRYVSPFDLGNISLLLGDEDRAVAWFEEAYKQRSVGMVFLRKDKADCVRHSPRLLALIGKIDAG
jgi:tetratricopeptide (TPR) repeat protein